jgi:hypothetical protein
MNALYVLTMFAGYFDKVWQTIGHWELVLLYCY